MSPRLSLARANHTVTIVDNKAYIFGGETAGDQLASNEMHAITLEHKSKEKPEFDYSVYPALEDEVGNGRWKATRARARSSGLQLIPLLFSVSF